MISCKSVVSQSIRLRLRSNFPIIHVLSSFFCVFGMLASVLSGCGSSESDCTKLLNDQLDKYKDSNYEYHINVTACYAEYKSNWDSIPSKNRFDMLSSLYIEPADDYFTSFIKERLMNIEMRKAVNYNNPTDNEREAIVMWAAYVTYISRTVPKEEVYSTLKEISQVAIDVPAKNACMFMKEMDGGQAQSDISNLIADANSGKVPILSSKYLTKIEELIE